jgi:hypothetical protein
MKRWGQKTVSTDNILHFNQNHYCTHCTTKFTFKFTLFHLIKTILHGYNHNQCKYCNCYPCPQRDFWLNKELNYWIELNWISKRQM